MGFGSFIKKAFKTAARPATAAVNPSRALKGAGEETGKIVSKFTSGLAGTQDAGQIAEGAADVLAETEEEKRRRLEAAEELNPTGSLGAGAPTVKRPNILGA